MKNNKLLAIGYWFDWENPSYPDPSKFVDTSWDTSQKKEVINYLANGIILPSDRIGDHYSWCRFRCGENSITNDEYTDGKYIWPISLIHYIKKHHIRLPNSFINDMNSGCKENIIKNIDFSWWISQQGWGKNSDAKCFKSIYDYGTLKLLNASPNDDLKKKELLEFFFRENTHIRKKYLLVSSFMERREIIINARFNGLQEFIKKAKLLDINLSFKEESEKMFLLKNHRI